MTQSSLKVYRIDMKYIRNLHEIDDRVLSVSPQVGKDERPFLGIMIVCNEHSRDLINTAKVLHSKYISGEEFRAKGQCLDFKRMEMECKKYNEKIEQKLNLPKKFYR